MSGDYYDFIQTGENCVGIALADISGKGIFASLLMASLQAALRSQATLDGNCGTSELVCADQPPPFQKYLGRPVRYVFLRSV